MTSSAHDADLKENNFRRTTHPQSFIAAAFIFSELDRGGFRSTPPVQKIEKKPGLDRVKARVHIEVVVAVVVVHNKHYLVEFL